VHVIRGGQARADAQQLPEPDLADQAADHPAEDVTLGPHPKLERGDRREHPVTDRPVGLEVVLPAEHVVVDPGDVRPGYAEGEGVGGHRAIFTELR
jgi:hypothetical protein